MSANSRIVGILVLAATACDVGAPALHTDKPAIEKIELLRRRFGGTIADIRKVSDRGTNHDLIILAQRCGILFDPVAGVVKQEFTYPLCTNPQALEIQPGQYQVFCRGAGFSPAYLADFSNSLLWKYSSSTVFSTAYGPWRGGSNHFYVGTVTGLVVLSHQGAQVSALPNIFVDIVFRTNSAQILTVEEFFLRGQRQLQVRDYGFNLVRTFALDKGSSEIVSYDWPRSNCIVYRTGSQLLFSDVVTGRIERRIDNPKRVMGMLAATVKRDGSSYLAVLVQYPPGDSHADLLIVSEARDVIYKEERLKLSRAIAAIHLGSNRDQQDLLVGIGEDVIYRYVLKKK
jgi:hypothetical protein